MGGIAFVLVVWAGGLRVRAVRRVLWTGWGLVALGSVAGLLLRGPYAAGLPLSGVFDTALIADVLGSRYGAATAVRLGLLVAVAGLLLAGLSRRVTAVLGVPLLAGLLLTTSLVGHAGVGDLVAVALPADAVHLGAVSAWLGGLVLLVVAVLRRSDACELAAVLPRWSRWAAGSVLLLVVTGTFASWREVRELPALTDTAYGRLLLLKTALVAGMLLLGAFGRAWVRRHYAPAAAPAGRMAPEPTAPDVSRLRRGVLLEAGTAVVVLAVTSVLVQTTPARSAYAPMFSESTRVAGHLHVQVDLKPARAGLNQMHVYYTGAGGKAVDVEEVTARLTRIGTDDVVAVAVPRDTLGHYEQLKVPLPDSGEWRLVLTTRTSDIDAPSTSFTVRIR